MTNYLQAIKTRTSVRTYASKPLEGDIRTTLETLCREEAVGPFGNTVRLKLLDLGTLPQKELRSLGTYGTIRGANLYILAAVKEEKGGLEDVGFCLEKVILKATSLGLGTCWLGGIFRRGSFARQMQLAEGELLPAITPVGYPAEKPSLVERAMRLGTRARRRKPWEELFFQADGKTPLPEAEAGPYWDVLDAVRQGPSASNRQPWRILKGRDGFRLFLSELTWYNNILGKIKLQNMDMGIAMCHFELAVKELGLEGHWQPVNPPAEVQGDGIRSGSVPGTSPQPIPDALKPIADWVP